MRLKNAKAGIAPVMIVLLMSVLFAGLAAIPAAAQYDTMQFHYNDQHTSDYDPAAGPTRWMGN